MHRRLNSIPGYIRFIGITDEHSLSKIKEVTIFEGKTIRTRGRFMGSLKLLYALTLLADKSSSIELTNEELASFFENLKTLRAYDTANPIFHKLDEKRIQERWHRGIVRAAVVFSIALWEQTIKEMFEEIIMDNRFFEYVLPEKKRLMNFIYKSTREGMWEKLEQMIDKHYRKTFQETLLSRGGLNFQDPKIIRYFVEEVYPAVRLNGRPFVDEKIASNEWWRNWNELLKYFEARHIIIHREGIIHLADNGPFRNELEKRNVNELLIEELYDTARLVRNISFMEMLIDSFHEWMFAEWSQKKI